MFNLKKVKKLELEVKRLSQEVIDLTIENEAYQDELHNVGVKRNGKGQFESLKQEKK